MIYQEPLQSISWALPFQLPASLACSSHGFPVKLQLCSACSASNARSSFHLLAWLEYQSRWDHAKYFAYEQEYLYRYVCVAVDLARI